MPNHHFSLYTITNILHVLKNFSTINYVKHINVFVGTWISVEEYSVAEYTV